MNLRLRANRALAGDRVSDRILHIAQHHAQVACRLPADPKAAQRREEIKPSQPSAASSVQRQWRGATGSARFTSQSRRRRQANTQWSQPHGQGRGDTCNHGHQRLGEEHAVQSSGAHPCPLQSPLAALPLPCSMLGAKWRLAAFEEACLDMQVGHPDYEVTGGIATYKGEDLLDLEPEDRARAGLFMSFQSPVEVPGVSNTDFLRAACNARRKAMGQPELVHMLATTLLTFSLHTPLSACPSALGSYLCS